MPENKAKINNLIGAEDSVTRNYLLLSLSGKIDVKLIDIYSAILTSNDETLPNKFQVIRNLSEYPDEVILKLLSEAYCKNDDVDLRREIVSTLQGIKPQLSIDFFIGNLGEPDDKLRGLIWKAVSDVFSPDIAQILLSRLKEPGNPAGAEAILQVFLEKGNAGIAGKALDAMRIKGQPASVLVLLFRLLRKCAPFADDGERIRAFTDIFFALKATDDNIRFTPQIREMEAHLESIGGTADRAEALKAEVFAHPTLKLLDASKDHFLLNGRKIYADRAAIQALEVLSKYKGNVIDNERFAELIDPNHEKDHGARPLTNAIYALRKAIKESYSEFLFDSLVGSKYGKGYYMHKEGTTRRTDEE